MTALFCLAGGFVGAWSAARLSGLGPLDPSLTYVMSLLAVAGAFAVAGRLAGRLLARFFLGPLDRLCGALLGAAGALAVTVSLSLPLAMARRPSWKAALRKATFTTSLLRGAQKRLRLLPDRLWESVREDL